MVAEEQMAVGYKGMVGVMNRGEGNKKRTRQHPDRNTHRHWTSKTTVLSQVPNLELCHRWPENPHPPKTRNTKHSGQNF